MKKKFKFILVFAILIVAVMSLVGCNGGAKQAPQNEVKEMSGDTSVLVVYFSWSGHLDSMAHWIADETGGDIVRVLAKEAYPSDYNQTADRAKAEKDNGTRPEITLELAKEEFDKYDVIMFGYPVWWYDLPMPMWTFLESVNLEGKTLIPFFSHEGSSNGASSLTTISNLAKGATVKSENALSIRGSSVASSENEVRNWVKELGYSKN